MVLTGEGGIVSSRLSVTETPFESHKLSPPYFRIFFILPRPLAIINLSW